jgi:uncharacterized protein YlbG (UPF0298 family)
LQSGIRNALLRKVQQKAHEMPKKGLVKKVGNSTTNEEKKEFASSGIEGTKGLNKKSEDDHGK